MNKRFLTYLFLTILSGILFFGLRPKGFYFSNNARWNNDHTGIHFDKYSMAYTDSSFVPFGSHSDIPSSLSVEIALKPAIMYDDRFKIILVLYNGDDSKQFLIGQWHSSIIFMNGNDYSGKQKTKRLAVREALLPLKKRFLTITSGEGGTKVYIDGQLAGAKKDLLLKVPNESARARLILGNSAYGNHYWIGDIYGLAIYGHKLTAKDAKFHFKRWIKEQNFSFAKDAEPEALYILNERSGELAFDQAGGNHHLQMPSKMHILRREVLGLPWNGIKIGRSFLIDIFLNILGFIPLGFLLNAILLNKNGFFEKHSCLITVSFCFLISLVIEFAQSWVPSRSSQMLDLILNTFGAYLGVMFYRFYLWLLKKAEWFA
ncbi:MAG: VanZ family protein [bacterium]